MTTEVKTIAPQTLGRYRAEYTKMRELEMSDDVIKSRMEVDAKLLGITLDELIAQIANLGKSTGATGQMGVAKKAWRTETRRLSDIVLGKLNTSKDRDVLALRKHLRDGGMSTVDSKWKGGRFLVCSPRLDLNKYPNEVVEVNGDALLGRFEGTWADGERYQWGTTEIPGGAKMHHNPVEYPLATPKVASQKVVKGKQVDTPKDTESPLVAQIHEVVDNEGESEQED